MEENGMKKRSIKLDISDMHHFSRPGELFDIEVILGFPLYPHSISIIRSIPSTEYLFIILGNPKNLTSDTCPTFEI